MKKFISSIICMLCVVLAFSACSQTKGTDASSPSEESSLEESSQTTAQGIDLSPEYQLATIQVANQAFPFLYRSMESLAKVELLDATWDMNDELTFSPDQLIQYVFYYEADTQDFIENSICSVPDTFIDPLAEAAFGVSTDFLHTSTFYSAETGVYTFTEASQPSKLFMITSPNYSREYVIILWMDLVEGQTDVYHITGESYLRFTADETQTVFSFISCSYNEYLTTDDTLSTDENDSDMMAELSSEEVASADESAE